MENDVVIKEGLDVARKKFLGNPLLYGIIMSGIIGIFFPFLAWLIPVADDGPTDLETLKKQMEDIQKTYSKAKDSIESLLQDKNLYWKLSSDKQKILRSLAQEQKGFFGEFFSLLFFLIQGTFFFLLGIVIERKWKRSKKENNNEIQPGTSETFSI